MVFKRLWLFSLMIFVGTAARAQSLGNAGTIEGSVTDQTGASIPDARVVLRNAVSGYSQATTSARDGSFRLSNIPPNPYHLQITASGFNTSEQDVTVRNAIPVRVTTKLDVSGGTSSVTVEAAGAGILENDPSAHIDVDRSLISKLPSGDPGGGLSQAITNTTGGVAADGNGLFHPLGDHAQTSFIIDGQPISDQQSKVFSTQLPTSAIQSMEVTTGLPTPNSATRAAWWRKLPPVPGWARGAYSAMSTRATGPSAPPEEVSVWASAVRSSGIF